MSIELTSDEQKLREYIQERVTQAGMAFHEGRLGRDLDKWILEAGEKAHELHLSLKARGHEPKHHAYMIENREMPADHPDFYMHFHPLEDLLKFLNDPHANDDPEDQTLGVEFKFSVYSKRWGRDDTYRITRTEVGWDVRHIMIGGPCDKEGRPFLFENFRQDHIQHPSGLGGWLEWLWDQASEQGLSHEAVQQALQELADWVSTVERSRPTGDVWFGY
jgi:hypothetical protein